MFEFAYTRGVHSIRIRFTDIQRRRRRRRRVSSGIVGHLRGDFRQETAQSSRRIAEMK